MLKRVDVVTGGASAVYGSDAVVGVVNFVTDNAFKGIKANAQYGISQYGDAASYEAGIAAGTDIMGGRGHIEGSFNYRHDSGLDSKSDRKWGRDVRTLQGAGTAASPYFQVIGARQNNVTFGGRINNGVLNDQQFTTGGVLIPFVHGTKTGQGGTIPAGLPYEIGGDGGYYNGQLRAELELKQYFGRFDYNLTDDVHFYTSVAYTDNHSIGIGDYYANQAFTISRDNGYLLPAYRTALGAATSFSMGKIFTAFPRGELETNATQLLNVAGLDGHLGDFRWELGYTRGRGKFDVSQNKARDQGRLFAALDSVDQGFIQTGVRNGNIVCRASLTNAAYAGCVPLNPFGVNSESQAAIDYITQKVSWQTYLHMDDINGSISGSPFSTWAGPLSIALSGEYRKTTEETVSNSLPTSFANCAGIAFNCNANTTKYSATVANLPKSGVKVGEGAVEVQIPLARDITALKSLDLNLAYRRAHYDTAGNANTWKVGVVWQPIDMVTVRVTRSRDFRAPTIDELFRTQAVSLTNFTDTINQNNPVVAANVPTFNGGNPNLKPEIAQTLTYGIVVKPASNFSIAVDAFNIKVKNFIFLVQGNSPPEQKICYDSKGSSPYCALITRGLGIYDSANPLAASAANAVTAWYQVPINIAKQTTYGADVELNYRSTVFDRPVGLRVLTTWQPHVRFFRDGITTNDFAGVAFGTNGIQATPKWRVTGFLDIKPVDSLTVTIQERWRSSLTYHSDPTIVVASPRIKAVAYTNLNLAYELPAAGGKMQMFLNVANLFNKVPPQAGFWGNPNPGQFGEFVLGDDVIGRYFTAGIRARF